MEDYKTTIRLSKKDYSSLKEVRDAIGITTISDTIRFMINKEKI